MIFDQPNYEAFDQELWDAIHAEENVNNKILNSSPLKMLFQSCYGRQGSLLTNKYAEGYPGNRYYGGTECVDIAENLAIERAKELFGAKFANVQAHSGSQANAAAYLALIEPGDTVMGLDLAAGGHLTHGSPVNFSGKTYNFVGYNVDKETELLDYDQILAQAKAAQPKLIVAGASSYSRTIDFDSVKSDCCVYLVDMAHIAVWWLLVCIQIQYLIWYYNFNNPYPWPVVDSFWQMTKFWLKIKSAIFPGTGGPLMHVVMQKLLLSKNIDLYKDYLLSLK